MKENLEHILEAIKHLTEEERKILEQKLVIMRLGKEFTFISHKLHNRKLSEIKGEIYHGTSRGEEL